MPANRPVSAVWLWWSPEVGAALASRDLSIILRTYRRLNGLSQQRLADLLGYDKTYVSMIETRRRTISDVGTLRHIARVLGLPAHVFGVTDGGDTDFAAMIQFADSTIRLAEIARQAGRTVDAVNELWPLVARLEARAAEGYLERDALVLLGQARVALGVSLGTVLPEERLSTAARWTGRGLIVAERLDEPSHLAHALRMHGNELRKADRTAAAITRLGRAVELSTGREGQGIALALFARAAGEHGDKGTFDEAIRRYRDLLDQGNSGGMLFNPFTFREVRLRGLVSTGRAAEAVRLMESERVDAAPAAPQWHVIERVTAGEVYLAAGDRDGATEALGAALAAAEAHRMPHQIQRAVRTATTGGLAEIDAAGRAALSRLNKSLRQTVAGVIPRSAS